MKSVGLSIGSAVEDTSQVCSIENQYIIYIYICMYVIFAL